MPTRKSSSKKTDSSAGSATAEKKRTERQKKPAVAKTGGGTSSDKRSSPKELERRRAALIELRDRVTGQITFLSDDAAHKDDIPPEDRTDEFDREFALSLVSTEQDALYEIDEALRRLDRGGYGRCESCDGKIESNRLRALPFARHCLGCQATLEQGTMFDDRGRRLNRSGPEHHRFDTVESPETD